MDGRHPIIEQLPDAEPFVPNSAFLNTTTDQIMLITGPNMAGKSTYIRQVATIAVMAQAGSFVPASSMRIGVLDRVFTRIGAGDDLARGRSTFLVEMQETANILNNATPKSLIVLDEIGRGTSTFDGISIAWSVAEYLHGKAQAKAKTLFATHYHELTDLADTFDGVKNFTVKVKEEGGRVVFLRRIAPGIAEKSFGIHVSQGSRRPRGPDTEEPRGERARREREGQGRPQAAPQAVRNARPDDVFLSSGGGSDALTAEDARLKPVGGVLHEVVVEPYRAGLRDEYHRRAAELEVSLLVAFGVRVSPERLDDRAYAERADVDEPEVAELRAAFQYLALVVRVDVGASQKRYRVHGVVFARNDASRP